MESKIIWLTGLSGSGTPFLLLFKYNMVEIFFILLPLSMITSLINLIIIRFSYKNLEVNIHQGLTKFFAVCLPSIIIGLFILKYFQEFINFKLLVSLVIFLSILFGYLILPILLVGNLEILLFLDFV